METTTKKRGRPRKYESDAARAKAWRDDQAARIVELERLANKAPEIIERVVTVAKPSAGKIKADPAKLAAVVRSRYDQMHQGAEEAKRLRVNFNKAANTARDFVRTLSSEDNLPADEIAFLSHAATFFDGLSAMLEREQSSAEAARAKRTKDREAKEKQAIANCIRELFGESLQVETVMPMANDLVTFDNVARDYLKEKHKVDSGYSSIGSVFDLSHAIRKGDAAKAAHCIAAIKLDMRVKGWHWTDNHGERIYSAGWSDFIEYRTYVNK